MNTAIKRRTSKAAISIMAIILMVVTLIVSAVPAQAATSGTGSNKTNDTMTVVTKGNWAKWGSESVTFTQTKGTRTNGKQYYSKFYITAKSTDGKHTAKVTLSGKSATLKLKPDKTYKVTISFNDDGFAILTKGQFTTFPKWSVSKTNKVSNYY